MPKKPSLQIKEDQSRSKPFYFSIPGTCSASGKRERRFFDTKSEAKTAREVELTRMANFGISQASLPSEVRRDAVRAEKLLGPHGLTLYEATKQFVEAKEVLDVIGCSVIEAARSHLRSELARTKSCSFSELMTEFIESKEQEQLSGDYLKQIRRTETVFAEEFGAVRACDLTTKMIRHGLSGFDEKLATYSAHLRVLKAALNFGIQHDYLATNPAEKIKHPKQAPREVKILSNDQVKALLDSALAKDPEMLAFFAVGIFAGLRPTELHALEWRDINFGRGEIFVRHRDANAKERVGRSVPIQPNLKKWLKAVQGSKGSATPQFNFRKRFEATRRAADARLKEQKLQKQATLADKWDADCMRHSAASNWDALTGNLAQTALWLGHTEQVHRKHYYHPVIKKESEEFWAIAPSAKESTPCLISYRACAAET